MIYSPMLRINVAQVCREPQREGVVQPPLRPEIWSLIVNGWKSRVMTPLWTFESVSYESTAAREGSSVSGRSR